MLRLAVSLLRWHIGIDFGPGGYLSMEEAEVSTRPRMSCGHSGILPGSFKRHE